MVALLNVRSVPDTGKHTKRITPEFSDSFDWVYYDGRNSNNEKMDLGEGSSMAKNPQKNKAKKRGN